MVSNVEKGRRLEKKARDELAAEGYKIMFKSIRTRFGAQDFASLFDIVAYGKPTDKRRYISVKTFVSMARHKGHIQDLENFKEEYGTKYDSIELWLWDGYKKEWNKLVM